MASFLKIAARAHLWLISLCLICFCLVSSLAVGQPPASSPPADSQPTDAPPSQSSVRMDGRDQVVVPSMIRGVIKLDGYWKFHSGDDPAWANPAYDDSKWDKIKPGIPLADQGIETYSGYGWYRLRLHPVPIPDSGEINLSLLVIPYSVGQLQVMINGNQVAQTQGMAGWSGTGIASQPTMYQSRPLTVRISRVAPDGTAVIAIRSWADLPINHGLLDRVDLGDGDSIGDKLEMERGHQWDQRVLAGMLVSFLFLFVTVLGLTLYLAQRDHAEYLWLALLCLSVSVTGAIETAFGMALLPLNVFEVLDLWAGRVFMATTLEFVLRFTASEHRKLVRSVQIGVLVLPILSLVHLEKTYQYFSLAAQVIFCAVVVVLLFRAWRRGRLEAGVMLVPFFLAATADSLDTLLDYASTQHWISDRFASHRFHFGTIEFSTGTVTYLIFLVSLIAVILYRFVHVSQEEQRSAAEIEAARSVQALLIPTQLPSNHNFLLESAYLPANGVGGDFFQVLPLKDDSVLLVVGDVSGKGLRAAMNASTLVGALRNELSHDPATVLNHLNQVMLGAISGSGPNSVAGFATCLCARIHPSGKMTIANAGHLSPYRDGREMELAADLPLGIIPDIVYEQATVQLKPGDRLVFLSDGVVEATNAQGELFGFERTQQVSHEPARYIAQIAQRFGQTDDITVLSVYFVPSAAHRMEHEPLAAR
jgi:sigma-B regulation protein RsbU (phosphoserine phosphatase)